MEAFKIFALLLGLCMVFAFVVGGLLWRSYGPRVSAAVEQVSADASHFARGHRQQACVDESFRRVASCEDIWCEMQVPIFTRGCLSEAAVSPELCADVPDSVAAAAFWPTLACVDIEARIEICERVLQEVVRTCFERSGSG